MSLVLHYKLNENLTTDSSGNSYTLTNNGGVSFSDPTYGNVAYFDSTSYLSLASPPSTMSGSSPRTYSWWVNIREFPTGVLEFFGHSSSPSDEFRAQLWTPERVRIYNNGNVFYTLLQNPLSTLTWYHVGITYDGVSEYLYINGAQVGSFATTFAVGTGEFFLGASPRYFPSFGIDGYLSDFRYYDDALSAAEISTLHTEGPNPTPPMPEMPETITPRAQSIKVTLSQVDGATAYRLTSQRMGSTAERMVKNNFTGLTQTITNLTPETEYTLRLYARAGNNGRYNLVSEYVVTTGVNSAANYDTDDFLVENGRFDLSELNTSSVGFIADVMNEIFTTGDAIDINVPGGRGTKVSTFVNMGANVSISDSEAFVAPFSVDAGSGQSVSLTLSDSSVVAVSYDETTEAITVGTSPYNLGDSFVLDGKKATIVDI